MALANPRKPTVRRVMPMKLTAEEFLAELLSLDRGNLEQLVANKVWECEEYRKLREEAQDEKLASEAQVRKVRAINEVLCEQWNKRLSQTAVEAEAIFFEKYISKINALKEANAILETRAAAYEKDRLALLSSQAEAVARSEQCMSHLTRLKEERAEMKTQLETLFKEKRALRCDLMCMELTAKTNQEALTRSREDKTFLRSKLLQSLNDFNQTMFQVKSLVEESMKESKAKRYDVKPNDKLNDMKAMREQMDKISQGLKRVEDNMSRQNSRHGSVN